MSITALVGLGNSGAEYAKTYHNVGAFVAEVMHAENVALRIYPLQGYMNESGVPVKAWLKMQGVAPDAYLVIHDDSDLSVGSYKLVRGGGSAGHKGIESLVVHLGTADFWRLRIGVRDLNEVVRRKAADFVLSRWSAAEEKEFVRIAGEASRQIQKA